MALPSPLRPEALLSECGLDRFKMLLPKRQSVFRQGEASQDLYYIQKGRLKLTVLSKEGKEATVAILSAGDFAGEESLGIVRPRRVTATAMTDSVLFKIPQKEMTRVLRTQRGFCDAFVAYLLLRNIRFQQDFTDQIFNGTERRLARTLLLLADRGNTGGPRQVAPMVVPKISQETLAEMIGSTRSRVNVFMNRFRRLGFIEYKHQLRIHPSLISVLLKNEMPVVTTESAKPKFKDRGGPASALPWDNPPWSNFVKKR